MSTLKEDLIAALAAAGVKVSSTDSPIVPAPSRSLLFADVKSAAASLRDFSEAVIYDVEDGVYGMKVRCILTK